VRGPVHGDCAGCLRAGVDVSELRLGRERHPEDRTVQLDLCLECAMAIVCAIASSIEPGAGARLAAAFNQGYREEQQIEKKAGDA
jgi:hypothetical protein